MNNGTDNDTVWKKPGDGAWNFLTKAFIIQNQYIHMIKRTFASQNVTIISQWALPQFQHEVDKNAIMMALPRMIGLTFNLFPYSSAFPLLVNTDIFNFEGLYVSSFWRKMCFLMLQMLLTNGVYVVKVRRCVIEQNPSCGHSIPKIYDHFDDLWWDLLQKIHHTQWCQNILFIKKKEEGFI